MVCARCGASRHRFMLHTEQLQVRISIPDQRLWLLQGDRPLLRAPVSTARNGPGERNASGCTPRGWHAIRIKVGEGCPVNAVFVGRRPTGEIYSAALGTGHPDRDWILTRILWLTGLEPGRNRCGPVDTLHRYVYIHGCPDELPVGIPLSHGCIRMHNTDLLALFARVAVGTRVHIA